MYVFISWSGDLGKSVAEVFRDWLPNVIQVIKPWMSSEDIRKGSHWSTELATKLSETKAGIFCVTPDNQDAPWLNYEAGALTRSIETDCVSPFLIGLKKSDLKGPLAQFQATDFNEKDTNLLIKTLNRALNNSLAEPTLESSFSKWWPDFNTKLEKIISTAPPKTSSRREDRDILEEILSLSRMQTSLVNDFANKLNTLRLLETQKSQYMSDIQIQAVKNQMINRLLSFFSLKGIKIMSIDIDLINRQIDILPQQEISKSLIAELLDSDPGFLTFMLNIKKIRVPKSQSS
jgi:hypothetical protein